jgi:hypothetical protein
MSPDGLVDFWLWAIREGIAQREKILSAPRDFARMLCRCGDLLARGSVEAVYWE